MSPAAAVMTETARRRSADSRRLAGFLMVGALLSKVLGLGREILIAQAIGASLIADSFRGGLTAILLPLVFLQGETVPAILIPAYRAWDQEGVAPHRFGALTLALTLVGFALFAAVELTAPFWIGALVGGFSPAAIALTLQFTHIMAFAMPASVLLCCLSAAEIARGLSRITSIRSTLVNLAVIGGVLVLLLTDQAVSLAWSFALAFNAVALGGLYLSLRDGLIRFAGAGPGDVRESLVLYGRRLRPLLLQPLAEQAAIWIERLLASGLAVGTLASLDYARTLTDSAVLLIGQPIGLAVLAAGAGSGSGDDSRARVDGIARPLLAVALPGSLFLVCLAPEVVQLIFHRGAFGFDAIAMTSQALRGIAAGLWATTLGFVLVRMLNSAGRNRRATAIVSAGYTANAIASAALVPLLGGFALGFGEALRGIVVLSGVCLAFGCGRTLLRIGRDALPGLGLLVLLLALVMTGADGMLPRLLLGSLATGLSAALCLVLMVGRARGTLLSLVRRSA